MNTAERTDQFPIMPAAWVKPKLIPPLFGLTIEAANTNRKRGVWLQGVHWKHDPQGNVVYNWRKIEEWMAS